MLEQCDYCGRWYGEGEGAYPEFPEDVCFCNEDCLNSFFEQKCKKVERCGKCSIAKLPLRVIDGMILCNTCHLEVTRIIETWYDDKKAWREGKKAKQTKAR